MARGLITLRLADNGNAELIVPVDKHSLAVRRQMDYDELIALRDDINNMLNTMLSLEMEQRRLKDNAGR